MNELLMDDDLFEACKLFLHHCRRTARINGEHKEAIQITQDLRILLNEKLIYDRKNQ